MVNLSPSAKNGCSPFCYKEFPKSIALRASIVYTRKGDKPRKPDGTGSLETKTKSLVLILLS